MAFVGFVNGIGALAMVASIVIGWKTGVPFTPFTAVEVAQLPVQCVNVKAIVEDSMADENVQFEVGIEGAEGYRSVRNSLGVYGTDVKSGEDFLLRQNS
ncbi:hypothetical protein HDU98_006876 [Podochytrium sp. JEL0797]|nr:hypothetical protein HDU98_006876 [Podochytrium sp. JEL0797]